MTQEETKNILQVLRLNYPSSFRNITKEDSLALLKLWFGSFKSYDYKLVATAVNEIIQSDTREFAPNIAQVKKRINSKVIGSTKESSHAWELVVKNAKCDSQQARKNFLSLPQNIQKALGGSYMLKDIGYATQKDLQYYRDRFIASYDNVCERELEDLSAGTISLEQFKQHDLLPAPEEADRHEGMRFIGNV